ncbi:hypothetical protein [Glycomyces sp. MUSA5-2]|uniref:hypothetical protein n=1 Tax=Glycomyces sp. MUSA5-2 TaxID=2053002 RepID=UPI00300A43E3
MSTLVGARHRIPVTQLLRETALNVLILSRIASGRVPDKLRKDDIEAAADHLVTLLRHAAWELSVPESDAQPSKEKE